MSGENGLQAMDGAACGCWGRAGRGPHHVPHWGGMVAGTCHAPSGSGPAGGPAALLLALMYAHTHGVPRMHAQVALGGSSQHPATSNEPPSPLFLRAGLLWCIPFFGWV